MQKTIIRPISELSKRMADVEAFVVEQDTPVHLTKNGSNHMVIMSSSHFEMMQAKIGMLENLLRSEAEIFARQIYSCPFGVWGKIGYCKARCISTSYQCGSKCTYSHDIIKKMFPDKLGER